MEENEKRWSSYSDYEAELEQMHANIRDANSAYAFLVSAQSQDITVSNRSFISTKQALLEAGLRLKTEIRVNKNVEPFTEIWERWDGEEGYVRLLRNHDFHESVPDWLGQYNDDIMDAAWELGYLKVGQEKAADPNDDDARINEVLD